MCEFLGNFLLRFRWTNDDFGVPAPLCTGLGPGLETGVQKNHFDPKPVILFGAFFRDIRYFMTFYFAVIFEVTSDPIF